MLHNTILRHRHFFTLGFALLDLPDLFVVLVKVLMVVATLLDTRLHTALLARTGCVNGQFLEFQGAVEMQGKLDMAPL